MKSKTVKQKYIPFPIYSDKNFGKMINKRPEFTSYVLKSNNTDISKSTKKNIDSPFEMASYQKFVKAYLSYVTPYSSLLLYHGLGTGKTCAAIGIAESDRQYSEEFRQNSPRIIIVASPNVQTNFKLQLFDESRLQSIDGEWIFTGCIGSSLISEINPTKIKNYPKEKIVQYIQSIISTKYTFMGYIQFANIINVLSEKDPQNYYFLKKEFNGSTIIIDEYHNIKNITEGITSESGKLTTDQLVRLVENTEGIRLILLSATPLYNNYKEIIWTINLLLKNDKRNTISTKDIFTPTGDFTPHGKEHLIQAIKGYISFVKGDDPFKFPFKIYPPMYPHIYHPKYRPDQFPTIQFNNIPIPPHDSSVTEFTIPPQMFIFNKLITVVSPEAPQIESYHLIMDGFIQKIRSRTDDESTYVGGISPPDLILPLQSLNISYPIDTDLPIWHLTGKDGLNRIVSVANHTKNQITYKYNPLYLGFFKTGTLTHPGPLKQYSAKIYNICCQIQKSIGIVIIYSGYLSGGLIPMALALEEMGIYNYHNNLFESSEHLPKSTGKYIMITGDPRFTSPGDDDLKIATSKTNMYGEKIKVILINTAGSEGVDLKYVRQVHIMEPWYNTNRMDQTIGRSVRNYSHHDLPFQSRNVEIFLYGTIIKSDPHEPMDLYIYRLAESKAIKMGRVTRVLKQGAVDCNINIAQQELTHYNLFKNDMGTVTQTTSSQHRIPNVHIGDMPYSSNCDFMESCEYSCIPNDDIFDVETDSYINVDKQNIFLGLENLMYLIGLLYTHQYYYTYDELFSKLNQNGIYSKEQVYYALTTIIDSKMHLTDSNNMRGTLANIGDYYIFQPIGIDDTSISFYDRIHPMHGMINNLKIELKNNATNNIQEIGGISVSKLLSIINEELMTIKEYTYTSEHVPSNSKETVKLFSYMGTAINIMGQLLHHIGQPDVESICNNLLVHQYVDRLLYTSKVMLIQAVLDNTMYNTLVPEYYTPIIIKYINEQYISTYNGIRFVMLYEYDGVANLHIRKTFLITNNSLSPITPESDYDTMQIIEEGLYMKRNQIKQTLLRFSVLGFIECKGTPPVFEFKIKDLKNSRSAGRACSSILVSNIYKFIPTRLYDGLKKMSIFESSFPKDYLCMLTMFILRYVNQYLTYESYELLINKNE